MLRGRCHCGAISYEMPEQAIHCALCHCSDCRRSAGAPMVSWALVSEDQLSVSGEPRVHHSSPGVERSFCGACGTGLFYRNPDLIPGMVDVQTATLDSPERLPPTAHIQTLDRIDWMKVAHLLPEFGRFPPQD